MATEGPGPTKPVSPGLLELVRPSSRIRPKPVVLTPNPWRSEGGGSATPRLKWVLSVLDELLPGDGAIPQAHGPRLMIVRRGF